MPYPAQSCHRSLLRSYRLGNFLMTFSSGTMKRSPSLIGSCFRIDVAGFYQILYNLQMTLYRDDMQHSSFIAIFCFLVYVTSNENFDLETPRVSRNIRRRLPCSWPLSLGMSHPTPVLTRSHHFDSIGSRCNRHQPQHDTLSTLVDDSNYRSAISGSGTIFK